MIKEVKQLYEKYPFPSRGITLGTRTEQLRREQWIRLCLPHIKQPLKFPKNSRILDAGCGTGDVTCVLGYSGSKVLGVDGCFNSIKIARNYLAKLKLRNVSFEQGYLNNLSFGKFDYIFCLGVLHHNTNPFKLYSKLLESLKPNGYIILGLYNKYHYMIPYLKRLLIRLKVFGKHSFDRKVTLAKKLFERQKEYTPEKVISIADTYAHPSVSTHTIGEILQWFKKTNVKYTGTFLPIEISYYPSLLKESFKSRREKVPYNVYKLFKSRALRKLDKSRIIQLLIELSLLTHEGRIIRIAGQKIIK